MYMYSTCKLYSTEHCKSSLLYMYCTLYFTYTVPVHVHYSYGEKAYRYAYMMAKNDKGYPIRKSKWIIYPYVRTSK